MRIQFRAEQGKSYRLAPLATPRAITPQSSLSPRRDDATLKSDPQGAVDKLVETGGKVTSDPGRQLFAKFLEAFARWVERNARAA